MEIRGEDPEVGIGERGRAAPAVVGVEALDARAGERGGEVGAGAPGGGMRRGRGVERVDEELRDRPGPARAGAGLDEAHVRARASGDAELDAAAPDAAQGWPADQ